MDADPSHAAGPADTHRPEWQAMHELVTEHQVLARAHGEVQQRISRWSAERAREQQAWERERLQLRAQLDLARAQLQQLRAAQGQPDEAPVHPD